MASHPDGSLHQAPPPGVPIEHFEPYDEHFADPHYAETYFDRMNGIRNRNPIVWSDGHWSNEQAGFWLLTAYDSVASAATDWRRFSSASGATPIQYDLNIFRMIPLEVDPPLHRHVRRVLTPYFTPETIEKYEPGIRQLVLELLDQCQAHRTCDFVRQFAAALPARVFFELILGLDEIQWLIELIDRLIWQPESAFEVAPPILTWCSEILTSRWNEHRSDDLIGAVAHAGREDDFILDDLQRVQILMLLLLAGMETTTSAIAHLAKRLTSQPSLRARLATATPAELDNAVDEFLRVDTPVVTAGRTLTADMELHGCPMARGDRVILHWGAANHDTSVYPEPNEIDFGRDPTKHLAFGGGPHHCLGSHLAKRELRIILEELCKLEVFERADDGPVRYRVGVTRIPAALPTRLAKRRHE